MRRVGACAEAGLWHTIKQHSNVMLCTQIYHYL